mmetsp:Transcript_23286/g.38934  ORF Transcript_23286/g.38934 Transcript_23286/m.38934 type:complete len:235 (-) Transcript_23286:3682-4386(-)
MGSMHVHAALRVEVHGDAGEAAVAGLASLVSEDPEPVGVRGVPEKGRGGRIALGGDNVEADVVGPDCGVLLEGIPGGDVEGMRRHEDHLDGVAYGAGAAGAPGEVAAEDVGGAGGLEGVVISEPDDVVLEEDVVAPHAEADVEGVVDRAPRHKGRPAAANVQRHRIPRVHAIGPPALPHVPKLHTVQLGDSWLQLPVVDTSLGHVDAPAEVLALQTHLPVLRHALRPLHHNVPA